jgi:DHA1 family tetracycline resistance protein-like MFS transporter
MVFVTIANHSMESVWAFFTIVKFHWTSRSIGLSLAFIGAVSILIQLGLVGELSKLLGDKRMAILGLLLVITGFLIIAFTTSVWMLLFAIMIYLIGGIEGTAMQSLITSAIPANEQGELQGGLGSLMGLTTLIAPPLMTSSFAYFTGKNAPVFFPGMPFFIAALLTIISLLLLLVGIKKLKTGER